MHLTSEYNSEMLSPTTVPCFHAVGGNHEASNYLWELYYGGWVAPNIWYLGAAGVVSFGGARIGGLSGIFNDRHYRMVGACTCACAQSQNISGRLCLYGLLAR